MLSLERRADGGEMGVEDKVEKTLCSLISLKCSQQDTVCLGCSSLLREMENNGVEVETEPVRREGTKERVHAALFYRLWPTIAESGSLYIRLSCTQCHLAWV